MRKLKINVNDFFQLLKLSIEKHGEGDAFMSAALVAGFNQIIYIRIYLQAAIRAFCAVGQIYDSIFTDYFS